MRASDKTKNVLDNSHDRQIYNTKHDEIMMWLYNKLKQPGFITQEHMPKYFTDNVDITSIQVDCRAIEQPVPYRGSVIGFADLAARFSIYFQSKLAGNKEHTLLWLYFEVKTSVNIGETIRQINYYRSEHKNDHWIVVAPPFPHSNVLLEQGIGFIPYQP